MQSKAPSVAGRFYPADRARLTEEVERHMAAGARFPGAPKALIAPHAGYVYSGPIAGSAHAPLARLRGGVRRVVLLGPAHYVPVKGVALPAADLFLTPLGEIPIDWDWARQILDLPGVETAPAAFEREHSLEVHLPFLQRALDGFTLVPMLVGGAEPALVDKVLERLWGGPETLVVISSDLSHYHDYDAAQKLDAAASRAIETLRPDQLASEQACGRHAIRGLLLRARALDMRSTTIDLRNSGDTAGGRDRVVGYGAWGFEYGRTARLSEPERGMLLRAAESAIRYQLAHGRTPKVQINGTNRALTACRATFVTLELGDQLRGCVGSMEPVRPLIEDVVHNACRAAFSDPRFSPLTPEEMSRLRISVSILGSATPLSFGSEADLVGQLRPDVDGLILQDAGRRGIFLPQVWEKVPDPARFIRHLKVKAGLPQDHWSPGVKVWRYTTESFGAHGDHAKGAPVAGAEAPPDAVAAAQ